VGTVAGTITITEELATGGQDITPRSSAHADHRDRAFRSGAHGESERHRTRNSRGFTVVAAGYSNTREIQQVMFQFNAAAVSI
jgi:hypothetical protein